MTVWLVDYCDYPENGGGIESDAAFTSLEAAMDSVRASHPPPYVVQWDEPVPPTRDGAPWTLVGHFAALQGYSTKHDAEWAFHEVPVQGS